MNWLNNSNIGWSLVIFVSVYWFWKWVIKPELNRLKADKRLNKRIKILRGMGFDVPDNMMNPYLPDEELNLLKSEETPTDEHIMLYYKMYCQKWDLKTQEMWTTEKPLSFDHWEKRAKENTEIHMGKGNFGFMKAGGYQYIIPMTCDTMIGIPPNQTYHRYHDYQRMVQVKDQQFMENLENAETNDG
jgi:hypothetical protein